MKWYLLIVLLVVCIAPVIGAGVKVTSIAVPPSSESKYGATDECYNLVTTGNTIAWIGRSPYYFEPAMYSPFFMFDLGTDTRTEDVYINYLILDAAGGYLVESINTPQGGTWIRLHDVGTGTASQIVQSEQLGQENWTFVGEGQISGNTILYSWKGWGDWNGKRAQWRFHDLTTGEEQVVGDFSPGEDVEIRDFSGNRIVYDLSEDTSSGVLRGIFLYNIGIGTIQLDTIHGQAPDLHISGNTVIWTNQGILKKYDVASDTTRAISDQVNCGASISGNLIVYCANNDIYIYNLTSGTIIPITNDDAQQSSPYISPERIVWIQDGDIYMAPATVPTPTTTTPVPTTTTPTITTTTTPAPTTTRRSSGSGGGGGGGGSASAFFFPSDVALPSNWYSCAVKGSNITTAEGEQTITVNLLAAGEDVTLFSNRIASRSDAMQVIVETEESLIPVNDMVSGVVRSATITTDPIFGDIKEIGGKFLVKFESTYPTAPLPGSRIKITLEEAPTGALLGQFRDGAGALGFEIKGFAYTMNIRTLNISPFNQVKLTMSTPPEWVTTSGGRSAVRIMRVTDEGAAQILETTATGYDQFGNYLFTAESPDGFSTFGVVSLIQVAASTPITSISVTTVASNLEQRTASSNTAVIPAISPTIPSESSGGGLMGVYLTLSAVLIIGASYFAIQKIFFKK